MNASRLTLCAAILAVAISGSPPRAHAAQDNPKLNKTQDLSGLHDFDLRVGRWTCHHKRLKERLAGSHEWQEFDGTQTFWKVMDGYGNVDENVLNLPGGAYLGVTLRAYDPKTGLWAIWWLDGRNPHGDLDPPVKGRFSKGVGLFYANDTLRGKPVKVRFTWSQMTPNSAHWEQAFSGDRGKTWETNWYADFKRAS
jgi:hypothetical protein